jgi:hypothetical protein
MERLRKRILEALNKKCLTLIGNKVRQAACKSLVKSANVGYNSSAFLQMNTLNVSARQTRKDSYGEPGTA